MDLAAGVLPEDYLRLRRMARAKLRQYAYHHSIQATDLVHLAWLKMEDHSTPSDKEHFFSYASVVMRNILVDRARKRLRQVEAAEAHPDAMDGVQSADDCNDSQLIQMDEALAKLGEHYPQCSEMVHSAILCRSQQSGDCQGALFFGAHRQAQAGLCQSLSGQGASQTFCRCHAVIGCPSWP